MYKAYIEPDLQTAQLRIYNAFNPFSGFMNATYILKSNAVPSMEAAKKVLEVGGWAVLLALDLPCAATTFICCGFNGWQRYK